MMETYRKEDIRRGDIYYADLRPVVGSEQGGIRPVVILQNNVGNRHSPTVIAAAITSRKGKHKLPTHVNLDAPVPGLYRDSIVLLETMKSADREHRVFKLQFAVGEFDMVIYDEKENCCEIFEIKHSDKQVPAQYRHLADQEKCDKTERRFGPIRGRYVLYRGEDAALENGVQYRNVERYLNDLPEMDITPVQEAGIEQTGPVL